MFLFTPRHVKQGRAFLKDATKLLAYKRDLWSEQAIAQFETGLERLAAAIRLGDKDRIAGAAHELDQEANLNVTPTPDAAWRENCEVVLVAIVIALGVRTYFLQPFTIPTGSMQPTLNGIIGYSTAKSDDPIPNILVRLFQKAVFGRTWIDVVAKTDDVIVDVRTIKSWGFFEKTELRGQNNTYIVNCPQDTLTRHFLPPLHPFKAGEIIARGYYDTGDHVFVDKFSYHFRKPHHGDVFVFNTQNVPTRDNRNSLMQGPSQFYIKRLGGTPGDTLQIRPPELIINGKRAEEPGYQPVMSAQDGYRGYSNESESQPNADGQTMRYRMNLLGSPAETFTVPADNYFALGDNSFHSSDSRDWGPVPQQNIMGRGILVYWPFISHWGLIH